MPTLFLKKGKESSLLRRHPWIFSGAIAKVEGEVSAGSVVIVRSFAGQYLGTAAFSPSSQIRARVLSFKEGEKIDEAFFGRALRRSIARRSHLLNLPTRSACRLVYGESDGLPGLIVDRYGEYLVCQFSFVGLESWRDIIVEHLRGLVQCSGIYERSDLSARKREGLESRQGSLWGQEPPELVEINEDERVYKLSIAQGHKTGYYLDQYDNRSLLRKLSRNLEVLNCFAYTGGFGVAALQGGAKHVTNVDSSAPALHIAEQNLLANGFTHDRFSNVTANVFDLLRQYREQEKSFDLIILDPPKFAETKAQFKRAARAYKDITLQASHLIRPGGMLMTYSCSGAIDLSLFQKITADGLLDAGRSGQIVHYLHQAEDHPIGLAFPEGLYLKGLVCRLD
ncbi:MAG: class I SAM-dependent methyltransferase [Pseudohongiellaceae bacterium]|nr:class I SAM-dependent methyltransferase [Pseudohongiellaceae bacterium]